MKHKHLDKIARSGLLAQTFLECIDDKDKDNNNSKGIFEKKISSNFVKNFLGKNDNNKEKLAKAVHKGISLSFLFPAFVILCLHVYGMKNVIDWIHYFNDNIKKIFFGFDFVNLFFILKDNESFNEFTIIERILDLIR